MPLAAIYVQKPVQKPRPRRCGRLLPPRDHQIGRALRGLGAAETFCLWSILARRGNGLDRLLEIFKEECVADRARRHPNVAMGRVSPWHPG